MFDAVYGNGGPFWATKLSNHSFTVKVPGVFPAAAADAAAAADERI